MKAGSDLSVGTYVGNGSDNRSITGVGFQPVWVVTLGDGEDSAFRPASLLGDNSYLMAADGKLANRIQAMEVTGFQIGSDANVNKSGTTYHYIAWAASSRVSEGSYTGDGSDNRSITGVGFQPQMVWVKRDDTKPSTWRPASVAGDSTLYWKAQVPQADRIQVLEADGFQVGANDEVNKGGKPHYYLALRDGGP